MNRIIGEYGSDQDQTLFICIAGMHGNEPIGVQALQNVFQHINQTQPPFRGKFIGLRGNINSLKLGKRYVHEDLNRVWSLANIGLARQKKSLHLHHSPEIRELSEIFAILDRFDFPRYKQKIFIDLHTTSAANGNFIVATELAHARYVIEHLEAPIILGLHEKLENTAIHYLEQRGFVSFAYEGGQHQDPQAINNLMFAVWKSLHVTSCIAEEYIPNELQNHQGSLPESIPNILELAYLHKVRPQDQFKMKPGYKNFDKINYGDILAKDKRGYIRAKTNGYLLMPLYQSEGDDGFFIVR